MVEASRVQQDGASSLPVYIPVCCGMFSRAEEGSVGPGSGLCSVPGGAKAEKLPGSRALSASALRWGHTDLKAMTSAPPSLTAPLCLVVRAVA